MLSLHFVNSRESLTVGGVRMVLQVGKAQSSGGCTLMSLHDVRQGLVLGNLAAISNGKAPMVIQNFSAGYHGNGIGYASKSKRQQRRADSPRRTWADEVDEQARAKSASAHPPPPSGQI